MNRLLGVLLVSAMAATLGACATRPLTDSEFRGFCYTAMPGRDADCDTIPLCDRYDTNVMSVRHASRRACSAACSATYDKLYAESTTNGCSSTQLLAFNWCIKYCNTNYKE